MRGEEEERVWGFKGEDGRPSICGEDRSVIFVDMVDKCTRRTGEGEGGEDDGSLQSGKQKSTRQPRDSSSILLLGGKVDASSFPPGGNPR